MARLELLHRGDPLRPAIVFIHGLDGDLIRTWLGPGCSADDCWPHWVGKSTGCDTWTLGYDAAMSRWNDQAMPLPDQADQVTNLLATHEGLTGRPIVMLGHSMGGLVIKTMVTQALANSDQRMRRLVERICGVVFVATPHQGSELASLAQALRRLVRPNPQVAQMQQHDAHLRQLNRSFRNACRIVSQRVV